MLLEELEWKLGGRIKSVLIVLLVMLFMWYAGGNHAGIVSAGEAWGRYLSAYLKCWEKLCVF